MQDHRSAIRTTHNATPRAASRNKTDGTSRMIRTNIDPGALQRVRLLITNLHPILVFFGLIVVGGQQQ